MANNEIINSVAYSADLKVKFDNVEKVIVLNEMEQYCYGKITHHIPIMGTYLPGSSITLFFCHTTEEIDVRKPRITFNTLYPATIGSSWFCKWSENKIQDYCSRVKEITGLSSVVSDYSPSNTIYNKKITINLEGEIAYFNIYLTLNLLRRMFSFTQNKNLSIALHLVDHDDDWPLDLLTSIVLLDSIDDRSHSDENLCPHPFYVEDGDDVDESCYLLPSENILLPTNPKDEVVGVFRNRVVSNIVDIYDNEDMIDLTERYTRYHKPWSTVTKNDIKMAKKLLEIAQK